MDQFLPFTNEHDDPNLPQTSFECPICFTSSLPTFSFPSCLHTFCQSCFSNYIQTQISSFKVLNIRCPQNNCSQSLQDLHLLKSILEDPLFTKLQALISQKTLNKTQKPSICPKPGCLRPVILSQKTSYSFTQCSCHTLICNVCGDFWHEGKTCLEISDPDFDLYARENNLKMCIICKSVIDRVEGCTHITCPVCDYEWCWLCGREYKDYHERDCPRQWNPKPPKLEAISGSLIAQIVGNLMRINLFLLAMPCYILFWPFWFLQVGREMRAIDRLQREKIVILTTALILSVVYDSMLVILSLIIIEQGEDAIFMPFILAIVLLVPWLIHFRIRNLAWRRHRKRWLTRNVEAFRYTEASRPTIEQPRRRDLVRQEGNRQAQNEGIEVNEG